MAHQGGRRSYYAPNAIFLITLNYLKLAMDFPQMQVQFGFTDTYMAMIVNETADICSPNFEKLEVCWISTEENIQNISLFRFFTNCFAAVDGSVQRIPRPKYDQASYYSGKHDFHCVKMQVYVGPQVVAMDMKESYKGLVHDFTIFQNTNTKNKILQKAQKSYNEQVAYDRITVERWLGRHKTLWGIMFAPFPLKLSRYYKILMYKLSSFQIPAHFITY